MSSKKNHKKFKKREYINRTLKHNKFWGMQMVFPKHRLTFDVSVSDTGLRFFAFDIGFVSGVSCPCASSDDIVDASDVEVS